MLAGTMLAGTMLAGTMLAALTLALPCFAQQLTNRSLSVTVNRQDGCYQFGPVGSPSVLQANTGAQIDHAWLGAPKYPSHAVSESPFSDALGSGKQLTVTCSGLADSPDLVYVLQLYSQNPYGTIQVRVRNTTRKAISVQAIRSVDAIGDSMVNLGGRPSDDRVLSDSFSEDWPDLVIRDLADGQGELHRGVGSQLIYNRQTKQSLFLAALTQDRFLTLLRLKTGGQGSAAKIASYAVDATGTTEIQKSFDLERSPAEDLVELSLPLNPGEEMSSERLLFATGPDYHAQLLAYGSAIRLLHHPRVSSEIPMGWWSWTAYYGGINQGESLAHSYLLAPHLKTLGFQFFPIPEGYQYTPGVIVSPHSTPFPHRHRAF